MKTTTIFSLIFALLILNVSTSNSINTHAEPTVKGLEFTSLIPLNNLLTILEGDFEEMLDVHAWMLDENAFHVVSEAEMIPLEEWMLEIDFINEPFTEVEDWMLDAKSFEANEIHFDEPFTEVEAWMLNPVVFSSEVQPMIEVEEWMLDVEVFDADYEEPFEKVEEWMLDVDRFVSGDL